MRSLTQISLRLRSLFFRSRVERELDEEFQFHLERQIEQNLAAGLSESEAREAALRALEGIELQKERCRDTRGINFIENAAKDTQYALRVLAHSPGFSAVVILTLGIGIGANTAIFGLVDRVVLEPLPYPDANRLVAISEADRKRGEEMSVSWLDFVDWRSRNKSFSAVAAVQGSGVNLTGVDQAERLEAMNVSAPFFSLVGVHSLLGRDFLKSDDRVGATPVALLSYSLWNRKFGGDPHVIGRSITLDGRTCTVVGVLPQSFRALVPVDIYLPVGIAADHQGSRGNHPGIMMVGKLKPGISLETARSEMKNIAAQLEQSYPASNGGVTAMVRPLGELVSGQARPALFTLWSAVGLLLLIACANVANLLLARAVAREREMAIRVALGAGRGRLISQLLAESGVLAICGAAIGCGIATATLPLILYLLPIELRQYVQLSVDLKVLGFTLALTLLTTFLFGLFPAYQAASGNPEQGLRSGGRTSRASFSKLSFRSVLVTVQIALALVLLAGGGLLIRSLMRLENVNPGFLPDRVLTARLNLPDTKYPKDSQQTAFVDELIRKIDSIPGVLSASGAFCLPLDTSGCWSSVFLIEGRPVPSTEDLLNAHFNAIEPDYLKTMKIPLLRGRDFNQHDNPGSLPVLIVNHAFVREFFPHEDPIGKRIKQDFPGGKAPYFTIVGVIGDVRRDRLDEPAAPEAFKAIRQNGPDSINLLVRTNLPDPLAVAPAIRRALAEIDPDVPVFDIRTMEYYVNQQTAGRRFPMLLLVVFGGIAILLAATGLYGVLSFLVAQRTQELGIRVALGAQTNQLLLMVMQQGVRLILAGLLLGLAGTWAITRFIRALLFGTAPNDVLTFISACCLLLLIGSIACWLPARRVTKVDPIAALRSE